MEITTRVTTRTLAVQEIDGTFYVLNLRDPDSIDVDGSSAPFSTWLPELHDAIDAAIRRYPDQDAPSWLAPSAVLGIIERYLSEPPAKL